MLQRWISGYLSFTRSATISAFRSSTFTSQRRCSNLRCFLSPFPLSKMMEFSSTALSSASVSSTSSAGSTSSSSSSLSSSQFSSSSDCSVSPCPVIYFYSRRGSLPSLTWELISEHLKSLSGHGIFVGWDDLTDGASPEVLNKCEMSFSKFCGIPTSVPIFLSSTSLHSLAPISTSTQSSSSSSSASTSESESSTAAVTASDSLSSSVILPKSSDSGLEFAMTHKKVSLAGDSYLSTALQVGSQIVASLAEEFVGGIGHNDSKNNGDNHEEKESANGTDEQLKKRPQLWMTKDQKRCLRAVQRTNLWLDRLIAQYTEKFSASSLSSSSSSANVTSPPQVYATITGGQSLHWRSESLQHALKHSRNLFGMYIAPFYNCSRTEIQRIVSSLLSQLSAAQFQSSNISLPVIIGSDGHPLEVLQLYDLGGTAFTSTYPLKLTDSGLASTFHIPSLSSSLSFSASTDISSSQVKINLKDKCFERDHLPILPGCTCFTCGTYSRSYLCHLLNTQEMLNEVLLQIHNVHHYLLFIQTMNQAKTKGNKDDQWKKWKEDMIVQWKCRKDGHEELHGGVMIVRRKKFGGGKVEEGDGMDEEKPQQKKKRFRKENDERKNDGNKEENEEPAKKKVKSVNYNEQTETARAAVVEEQKHQQIKNIRSDESSSLS